MKKVRACGVQRFSEPLVAKWLLLLKETSWVELFDPIVKPIHSASQLKAVKEVGNSYT